MVGALVESIPGATPGPPGPPGTVTYTYQEVSLALASFTNVGQRHFMNFTVPANTSVWFEVYTQAIQAGTSATYNLERIAVHLDEAGPDLIVARQDGIYRADQNSAATGGSMSLTCAGFTPLLSAGAHQLSIYLSSNGLSDPILDAESRFRIVFVS